MTNEEYLHQERMDKGECDAPNTGFGEQKLDLDTLKRLAKAATQGLWDYKGCEVFLKGTDFWPIVANCRNENDAAFIAVVNPNMMLKLIAELRKVTAAQEHWQRVAQIIADVLVDYQKPAGVPLHKRESQEQILRAASYAAVVRKAVEE